MAARDDFRLFSISLLLRSECPASPFPDNCDQKPTGEVRGAGSGEHED